MHTAFILLALLLALCAGVAGFVQLAPRKATALALSLTRRHAGLTRHEITLPSGLRYVYLEGGSGETLMLMHGFGADKDNFARVAARLTPRYRVIIPDHIGFGESDHPADADYRPQAQVERLRALASALGAGRPHLGGSSMGGQIAIAYAAQYPAEVASLWLLDPAGVWSAPRGELAQTIEAGQGNPLVARNEDEFARLAAFVMSDPPFIPRAMLNVMAQESIRNVALRERIFEQIAAASIEDAIRGSSVPALIVWGERDRALSAASAAVLHALMPRSQVLLMPGVGHLPMLERPRQSARDYLRFRAGLQP